MAHAAYPGQEPHAICGTYAAHEHAEVRAWLARPQNQRVTPRFVPASCSRLNLAECFFPVITTSASCITHTSRFSPSSHLCPFALWSAFRGLQIGRPLPLRLLRALRRPGSLARRDRSHVRTAVRVERDLGVPFTPLNALTGHRSSAPEDYGG